MDRPQPYRFPGIVDFIDHAKADPIYEAKIPGLFFLARAADSLSQLCEARPEHREDFWAVAVKNRANLAEALATLDRAMAKVRAECFPAPAPEPEHEEKPNGKAKPKP